jgi:hypothetical protein
VYSLRSFAVLCVSIAASLKWVTNAEYPFHTADTDRKLLGTQWDSKTLPIFVNCTLKVEATVFNSLRFFGDD